jgi:RimJ/RimL family protein N-acetyltransferase
VNDIAHIVTPNMTGEGLRPEHGDELCRLLLDPAVIPSTWPFVAPPTRSDILATLQSKVEHWARHGFGFWLLRDGASGEMVGRGGLQYTYAAGLDAVEVAWVITPERWGQGLATELAEASLRVAFGELDLLEVVALTLPHNRASRRVMEKTGFRFERVIDHAGLPHVLYRRPRGLAAGGEAV